MPTKVLVIYFTQTGQLRDIVRSVTEPLLLNNAAEVTFEELKPLHPFPFPWTSDQFFQAMPESVKGIACEMEPLKVDADEDFDLVIVAWQPWFLSPSIPVHSFFQSSRGRRLIRGKPVVTIIGSRNMWVMAQEVVKGYIKDAGGHHAGNIVLYDKAANLLSVISVIRWMFKGRKERYLKIVPPAGIAVEDIKNSAEYGKIIRDSLIADDLANLNPKLVAAGAVNVRPGLVMIEKRGIVFFRLWAGFILKKGSYGDKARVIRARMFKYYLLTVIYLVSPFASLFFSITAPFRRKAVKKQVSFYQSV
jgi:hypothetical protein